MPSSPTRSPGFLRRTYTAPARLRPTAWIAALFLAVWLLAPGVDRLAVLFGGTPPKDTLADGIGGIFDDVGRIADFFFGQSAFELLAFAALFTGLGWWHVLQREPTRLRPAWFALVPLLTAGLFLVAVVIGVAANPDPSPSLLLMQTVAMLAVAVVEEFGWRGVAVVGLRGSRFPEWSVWLLTSWGFAFMHLLNLFSGAELGGTLFQVVFTFILGTACYLGRRAGGIWLAVAIHFANNLLQVAAQGSVGTALFPLVNGIALGGQVLMLLAIPATIVLLVRESRRARRAEASEPVATSAV